MASDWWFVGYFVIGAAFIGAVVGSDDKPSSWPPVAVILMGILWPVAIAFVAAFVAAAAIKKSITKAGQR